MKPSGPGKTYQVEDTLHKARRKALERRSEVCKLLPGISTVGSSHATLCFVQIQLLYKNKAMKENNNKREE